MGIAKLSFELDDRLLESLERRISVVLDTNMWITVSEQKSEEAREVRRRLSCLVNKEAIFCPLTPATIWELRKQGGRSIELTTKVMEELSENISFRSYEEICSNEAEGFVRFVLYGASSRITLRQVYGPVVSYLAPGFRLEFPEGWKSCDRENLTEHVHGIANRMSLGEFVHLIEGKPPTEDQKPPAYLETNLSRYEFCKGDVRKMRRVEQEHVARSTVIPLISARTKDLPAADQVRFAKELDSLPKSKKYQSAIEYLLSHLPSIRALVEVMTISGLDTNRKDTYRDFYDREIMINALSYPDIFAANDKWINSLMNNKHRERTNARLRYCRNTQELGDVLKEIERRNNNGLQGTSALLRRRP